MEFDGIYKRINQEIRDFPASNKGDFIFFHKTTTRHTHRGDNAYMFQAEIPSNYS